LGLEYPELKRAVREQYDRFAPAVVLIEEEASGTQLIQELIAVGLHAVTLPAAVRGRTRSCACMRKTAMIENGFVHLPEQAPWLAPYLAELTAFPNDRHDDQVDSTAQMLDWFKSAAREPGGLYCHYRMFAERLRDSYTVHPAGYRQGRASVGGDHAPATCQRSRGISTGPKLAVRYRIRAKLTLGATRSRL
jgi:predicted phage terminase large subunit-like protein